jgi:hypothetical protein
MVYAARRDGPGRPLSCSRRAWATHLDARSRLANISQLRGRCESPRRRRQRLIFELAHDARIVARERCDGVSSLIGGVGQRAALPQQQRDKRRGQPVGARDGVQPQPSWPACEAIACRRGPAPAPALLSWALRRPRRPLRWKPVAILACDREQPFLMPQQTRDVMRLSVTDRSLARR